MEMRKSSVVYTWSINVCRLPEASANGWSLLAAVRSFLHFSQLSAWLSVSGGRRPPNVLYRLTVTSPVFCSKFLEEAEEHVFPLAYMGQDTSIKVSSGLSSWTELRDLQYSTVTRNFTMMVP